jgi:hypothetical protein
VLQNSLAATRSRLYAVILGGYPALLFSLLLALGLLTSANAQDFQSLDPTNRAKLFSAALERQLKVFERGQVAEVDVLKKRAQQKTMSEQKRRPVTRYNYSCISNNKRSTRSQPFGTDCVQVPYQSSEGYFEERPLTFDEEYKLRSAYESALTQLNFYRLVIRAIPLFEYVISSWGDQGELRDLTDEAYVAILKAKSIQDLELELFALTFDIKKLCYDLKDGTVSDHTPQKRMDSLCKLLIAEG